MKKHITTITIVAILAVGGYFGYAEYKKKTQLSKEKAIEVIVESGNHSSSDFLKTMQAGFLTAWAKAILAKDAMFSFANKAYKTIGGKAA